MKLKRNIPYFLTVILILIILGCFLAFGPSYSGNLLGNISTIGTPRVELSSGSYPADTSELTAVILPEDLPLLDTFTALTAADFSGSTCYEDIRAWAAAHPEVAVRYTVTLPNGTAVESTATSVDLSGLDRNTVSAVIASLQQLPSLSAINLGSSSQSSAPLTGDDVNLIQNTFPGAAVSYSVDFLGQALPISTESVDLSGLTSAQVSQAVSGLSMLPNLKTVKLADNAVTDGSLTWDDLTAIAQAAPGAALDYNFSIGGTRITTADTAIDLSSVSPSERASLVAILSGMSQLQTINLGSYQNGWTFEDLSAISAACPNACIAMEVQAYGKTFNLADTVLDLNHIPITDNAEQLKAFLPYMKNLSGLDMDSCGVPDEVMAQIRDAYPNVNVVWRIWFGTDYSVRTDVVKILASKPSKGGRLNNSNTAGLKYCTKVRYLDLGHNSDLSDFSFVSYMPDLQIVVISMTGITDLTPFASCQELLYLEMGNTHVTSIAPLAQCAKLKHLNIGTNLGISDITPMYDRSLLRFWIGTYTSVPREQMETYQSMHPECEVNMTVTSGLDRDERGELISEGYTAEGWKYYQQQLTADWQYYEVYHYFPEQRPLGYFKVAYQAFEYHHGEAAYAFSWNDPMLEPHGDDVEPVNMKIVDVSLLSEHWEQDLSVYTPIYPDDPSYG